MRWDRVSSLLELVRWTGRGLRAEYNAPRGLLEACYTAVEVGVPREFLCAAITVLDDATRALGFTSEVIYSDFPEASALQNELAVENGAALEQVAQVLADRGVSPSEALLLGDLGVLLGLYETVEAGFARVWVVGLPGEHELEDDSVTERAVSALPREMHVSSLGRLAHHLEGRVKRVEVEGREWLVPDGDLLVTLMAARVGDPEASPESATWVHLAAAIKARKDVMRIESVLELAEALGLSDRAQRGLEIIRQLFPELGRVVPAKMLRIPAWERVALRVAANRLVRAAVGESD